MADECAVRISDTGVKGCGDDAPVLFLLHGYFESIEVWDTLMPYLKPQFRVVAMDIPGHGVTQVMGEIHTMEFVADTAAAVLRELGIEKCIMVGHSMGGYVTVAMMKKYPQMLSGAVLLHSTPNADTEAKKENRAREIELIQAGKKDLLARTLPFGGFAAANKKRFSTVTEELADQIILTDEDGVVALLRGMGAREDMNEMLQETSVPFMFIFGRGDEYISQEVALELVEKHTKAKVVWMEESGHMSLVEEPAKVAEALREFAGME